MEGVSSSSPLSAAIPRSWTYHVFLSFRGQDTRKGFTDHLFASLERKGIRTFKDDKDLERGEVISKELLKAIEESMFAVTVLSPNYACSTWCLDELQKIVECNNNLGVAVVPIFYGVDPSEVRHQRGSFEEAFRKHEVRFGQDKEKVERWRDALGKVASYSGWDSKDWHDEAELVESIAQHIHKKLIPKLPSCTENLVGIASRVEQVYSLLGKGLNDVRFVGVWGMGGIGKTTIARAVYEAIQGEFQVSCHLANVREVSSEKAGLVQLQKELVSHSNIRTFNNLFDGKRTIENSLCRKKVLLVLDDVSERSQLENLAEKREWFGPGSRVIITTRDMHLLKIHGMNGIYEVEGLVQDDALHLFCLKAFKRDHPEEGYLDLSREVVKYTSGLPLALEVLGSHLYGRTIDVWHSAVKKIKSNQHVEIFETLKISYECLDSNQQNIFLDIACFFKGMKRDKVIDILEKCGHNPRIEIDVLIERSLVTLNQEMNWLEMHDLLQEMGRNIVIQESPNDPGKRSRLWSQKDIDDVLTKDKGTEAIQGIVLRSTHYHSNEARWNTKAFSKTSQLKFLHLNVMKLPLGLNHLPSSLKVLQWPRCPLKTLPLADEPYEVVQIYLSESKIEQLWLGIKFLENLKYLNLHNCVALKRTPNLSAVPILETLILERCSGLTEVDPSLVHHKNLVELDLSWCDSLKTLPGKLEMSSLKILILDYCLTFEILPEFGDCMIHLSTLSLFKTAITELPTSLGCLVGLSDLNLADCYNLVWLPDTFHRLKSLKTLNASRCPNLHRLPPCISSLPLLSSLDLRHSNLDDESFPDDFYHFPSLTELDLSGNNFVSVPISIHKLPKLRCLRLNSCRMLQNLPVLPSSIIELQAWMSYRLESSEFNPLSKMYSVFASRIKDRGEVFNMVIPGSEIPSWFVHREDGDSVSVPYDCPLNERLGIVLCFHLETCFPLNTSIPGYFSVLNGNRLITRMYFSQVYSGSHLYIICLTNDDFSGEIHHGSRFHLLIEANNDRFTPISVLASSARWVYKQDIEDLNESIEPQPKKQKKN